MQEEASLYQQVVAISQEYLGPAAERFMRRQIQTHLHKEPEDLRQADLPELISWVRLTFALLTDDMRLITAFSDQLAGLAPAKRSAKRKTRAAKK